MPRPVIQYRTTSAEAFRNFKEKYPNINISYETFKEIIRTCNKMIVEQVLDTGEKFRLPHGFGDLCIHKWKPKRWKTLPDGRQVNNLSVDWKKSRELGKKILHLNYHTGGYKFRWIWFKSKTTFKHSNVFSFKPNRITSRKLAQYLKIPNSPYPQIYRHWERLTYG